MEPRVPQNRTCTDDPRFADDPVVAGPLGLRFYAGARLVLRDGSRVGTLCIGDVEPRALDAAELGTLRRLAAGVRAQLEAASRWRAAEPSSHRIGRTGRNGTEYDSSLYGGR
jgi:GAF domain-containing protein